MFPMLVMIIHYSDKMMTLTANLQSFSSETGEAEQGGQKEQLPLQ